jgi:hypothetical protein
MMRLCGAPQDQPTSTRLADVPIIFLALPTRVTNIAGEISAREGDRRIQAALFHSRRIHPFVQQREVCPLHWQHTFTSLSNVRSLSRYNMYPTTLLVVFLFSHGSYFGPQATVFAATVVAEDLEIDNVEECLDCTKSGCWYCESQHQFTLSHHHFSMCYCSPDSDKTAPILGYCGKVFASFNRYANSERACVIAPTATTTTGDSTSTTTGSTTFTTPTTTSLTPAQDTTTTGGNVEPQQQELQQQDQAKESKIHKKSVSSGTIILLVALLPLLCCLGLCSGCFLFYYFYHLKQDLDEERRIQECTAVMKVVTARELAHEAMSTSNTTAHTILIDVDEAEERQHKQRYAQIEDEQELKLQQEHNVIS